MTTVTRTAGAPGNITLTTRNGAGSVVTPVSDPDVRWYTNPERTDGERVLVVTGSNGSYTASWDAPAAPAEAATRYLRVSVETAPGTFSVESDDDIAFAAVGVDLGQTDYTTLDAVKADLGITDTNDDDAIRSSITAASRYIDDVTGTTFYPVTETRRFAVAGDGSVWTDRFTVTDDLVVQSSTDGMTWTTVPAANYVTWPYNATVRERIEFPAGAYQVGAGRPTVQITATWGYPSVPPQVERACRLKAARLFRRADSPEGVAGSSEFGVVRISQSEDPDVRMLLNAYIDPGIA